MYLTKESINSLEEVIFNLNNINDDEEKNKFLEEHVEDSALLLKTLRKLNKSKMPKNHTNSKNNNVEAVKVDMYKEDEVYSIFKHKNDNEIMNEYSLTALKQMYVSVYKRKPTSSYTKERIISTLRNRLHTMNRTAAFMKMAEEREKTKQ